MRIFPRMILILKWHHPSVNPVIQLTHTHMRLLTGTHHILHDWVHFSHNFRLFSLNSQIPVLRCPAKKSFEFSKSPKRYKNQMCAGNEAGQGAKIDPRLNCLDDYQLQLDSESCRRKKIQPVRFHLKKDILEFTFSIKTTAEGLNPHSRYSSIHASNRMFANLFN